MTGPDRPIIPIRRRRNEESQQARADEKSGSATNGQHQTGR
ncbi:hypothetical protein [Streptomyces sp. NPDC088270]